MMVAVVARSIALACLVIACSQSEGDSDTAAPSDAVPDGAADLDDLVRDTTPAETIVFDTGGTEPDSAPEADSERTCEDDPRPFFCPCDINTHCESSYCIAVDDPEVARRCSRTCQDSCPNGWECKGIGGVGDPVFICQPPIDTLCDPCEQDADCQAVGARCIELADGKFCGRNCREQAESCPTGYACQEIVNEDGQIEAYQCLRTSGSCNCPDGTDYQTDPANCAFCGNACVFPHGVPGCAQASCFLAGCEEDWKDLDDADANGCEYRCTLQGGDDWPDATCSAENDCDQNCDGIDGDIARALFVAPFGARDGSGSMSDPVDTISRALQLAGPAGKDHVYVAAGTYNESVDLIEGVSIFGGYSNDGRWVRDLSQFESTITWSAGTNSVRVVIASGIDQVRTVLDGVEVISGTNANPSGSSYAIWVEDCTAALEFVNVTAIGGNGGAGAAAGIGATGGGGSVGSKGTSSSEASGGASGSCTDCGCDEEGTYGGPGGAGAPNACSGGTSSAGGKGGKGNCGDDHQGQKGETSPGGAAGGPAASGAGNAGTLGSSGAAGADGVGGTASGTVSESGFWFGVAGGDGATGGNGVGGGGGSGGGGNDNGGFDCASWGAGGGGGGSGGCGGGGARGGQPGGGSFGVFLVDSSVKIINVQAGHKNGGNGGAGGQGGSPGLGKGGGAGGDGCFDAGDGGAGGKGGDGGRGGHGGGGAGGVAYGLYLAGDSDPSCQGLSFEPPGSGGTGGLGGRGPGNRGADGAFGDRNRGTPGCP